MGSTRTALSGFVRVRVILPSLIWSATKGFTVVDLAKDYYLVRFSNERDVEYALTEGPWTVMDHKILKAQRGKFARVTVEIDLNKLLISQFNFEGRIQRVEYEYLPTICFGCGKIGHYKDACPDGAEVVPPEKVLPVPPMVAETQAVVVTELAGRSEMKFGSWMVVVRKPQVRKLNVKGFPKNMATGHNRPIFQDSRFGILDSVNEEESIPDFMTKVIRSRSSIPMSSPNNVPIAMQGMLAQTGNLSANPYGIPTIMHSMHENLNDHNTTFPHDSHANQSPMQDMRDIPSFRIPMHVPTSLNPLHHSVVSFPKIPKPPNLDKAPSSSRTTRGIPLKTLVLRAKTIAGSWMGLKVFIVQMEKRRLY
ncbi:hypothetical protein CUMW_123710 [Citrus unshiu]|nr:hypothetical protein CUMW_123710 [Citrus unshiu]